MVIMMKMFRVYCLKVHWDIIMVKFLDLMK